MCIYTVKKTKITTKKILKRGARLHRERPKIRRLHRKGYECRTNKDLSMLCPIQVNYNVFFRW